MHSEREIRHFVTGTLLFAKVEYCNKNAAYWRIDELVLHHFLLKFLHRYYPLIIDNNIVNFIHNAFGLFERVKNPAIMEDILET